MTAEMSYEMRIPNSAAVTVVVLVVVIETPPAERSLTPSADPKS